MPAKKEPGEIPPLTDTFVPGAIRACCLINKGHDGRPANSRFLVCLLVSADTVISSAEEITSLVSPGLSGLVDRQVCSGALCVFRRSPRQRACSDRNCGAGNNDDGGSQNKFPRSSATIGSCFSWQMGWARTPRPDAR